MQVHLRGEEAMQGFGLGLGEHLIGFDIPPEPGRDAALMVHLIGNLGAGKTTLVRGILRGMGHEGPVRSPTYTLVEPYAFEQPESDGLSAAYHMDLYRLADPEELEYIGIRDLLEQRAVCLVEWPDKGLGFLPEADLTVQIDFEQEGQGRVLLICSGSHRGDQLLSALGKQ